MTLPRALDNEEFGRQGRFEQVRPLAERQGWLCPWCNRGLPRDLLETLTDHIIPVARGGPDVEWNWQVLHALCNTCKREHLTEQAVALAAQYGVVISPPVVRPGRGPTVRRIDLSVRIALSFVAELHSTPAETGGRLARHCCMKNPG